MSDSEHLFNTTISYDINTSTFSQFQASKPMSLDMEMGEGTLSLLPVNQAGRLRTYRKSTFSSIYYIENYKVLKKKNLKSSIERKYIFLINRHKSF